MLHSVLMWVLGDGNIALVAAGIISIGWLAAEIFLWRNRRKKA